MRVQDSWEKTKFILLIFIHSSISFNKYLLSFSHFDVRQNQHQALCASEELEHCKEDSPVSTQQAPQRGGIVWLVGWARCPKPAATSRENLGQLLSHFKLQLPTEKWDSNPSKFTVLWWGSSKIHYLKRQSSPAASTNPFRTWSEHRLCTDSRIFFFLEKQRGKDALNNVDLKSVTVLLSQGKWCDSMP